MKKLAGKINILNVPDKDAVSMHNVYHIEPLEFAEISYLLEKARKEKKVYNKLLVILLSASALISFAGSWKYVRLGDLTLFSWEAYFISASVLMLVCGTAIWFSRQMNLRGLQADLKHRTKIVESAIIIKKKFMPHNSTFHFYLNSTQKFSIEVNESYFKRLSEGDEINIEYTAHAHIYFGYF